MTYLGKEHILNNYSYINLCIKSKYNIIYFINFVDYNYMSYYHIYYYFIFLHIFYEPKSTTCNKKTFIASFI